MVSHNEMLTYYLGEREKQQKKQLERRESIRERERGVKRSDWKL